MGANNLRIHATIFIALFGVCVLPGNSVRAADFRKVDGEYTIATPDGGKELEFGLIIRGDAAKRLYDKLSVAAVKDLCTGGRRKDHPSGMQCIKDGNEFTCSLGYGLKSGQTTPGPLTC